MSLKSGTNFPPAGLSQSVLQPCPFVWVVELYVLVGRVAPVLFVHKGQVCLNAGADERNPLSLQAFALSSLQVRLGYDGRMPDNSTRLVWMRLRSGSAACHDVRIIKNEA